MSKEPKKEKKKENLPKTGKHPGGRPTIYTKKLADEICYLIASTDKGIRQLCEENPHWPQRETIYAWKNLNTEFSNQYALSKSKQMEILMEETINISDEALPERDAGAHVARNALRVKSRTFLASKIAPKIYGDQKLLESLQTDNESMKQELLRLRLELQEKNKREY